ncbi:MAG: AIM24 family protein [bacterium]
MQWTLSQDKYNQFLKINLKPNDTLYIKPNHLVMYQGNISIENQNFKSKFLNFIKGIKNRDQRNLIESVINFFITKITANEDTQIVLSNTIPGDITPIEINQDEEYIIIADYYVAHYGDICLSLETEYIKKYLFSNILPKPSFSTLRSILSLRSILRTILKIKKIPLLLLEYLLSEKNFYSYLKHLLCLSVKGNGIIFLGGFGTVKELQVDQETMVNYFHLIAMKKNIPTSQQEIVNFNENLFLKINSNSKIYIQSKNWNLFSNIGIEKQTIK